MILSCASFRGHCRHSASFRGHAFRRKCHPNPVGMCQAPEHSQVKYYFPLLTKRSANLSELYSASILFSRVVPVERHVCTQCASEVNNITIGKVPYKLAGCLPERGFPVNWAN